jgi:hypothetical protein
MSQGAIVRIDRQNYLAKNLGHVTGHVTRVYTGPTHKIFIFDFPQCGTI